MRLLKSFVMLLVLLSCSSAFAQDSLNVRRLGMFSYMVEADKVALQGNYAYVAAGQNGLSIIEISDPAHPVQVGFLDTPTITQNVAVSGNYAYLAESWNVGQGWMRVIDISNATSPLEAGFCTTSGQAYSVAVSGNCVYVGCESGLDVIEVSNPSLPVRVGNCNSFWYGHDVMVVGNCAYVAASDRMAIVNVSNPAAPLMVGSCGLPDHANGVAVAGDYAYVADYNQGFRVVNICNPAAPYEVGSCPAVTAYGVAVSGAYAYVACSSGSPSNGMWIIDITNPTAPTGVGQYGVGCAGVAVAGSYAYVAAFQSGFHVVRIDNPTAPITTGVYDPGVCYNVAVSDNYAYVADAERGLSILDVSNPSSIWEAGWCRPGNCYARDVAVQGSYAYLADNQYYGGLRVINIWQPASPVQTDFEQHSSPSVVAVSGSYALISGYQVGCGVISVARPDSIYYLGTSGPTSGVDIAFLAPYAYVAGDNGLNIVDVSPSSPHVIGTCTPTGGVVRGVAVANGYAYTTGDGLSVINITAPSAPYEVGHVHLASYTDGVAISGSFAFVTARSEGLRIVNVANPTSPVEVGHYDTPGIANAVVASGTIAYVADYHFLGIYDCSHAMGYVAPRSPDSLVIRFLPDQYLFRLDWARVSHDISGWPLHVDRYVVLRNASLSDAGWDSVGVPVPPDTTVFLDSTAFPGPEPRQFYQVKAVKN